MGDGMAKQGYYDERKKKGLCQKCGSIPPKGYVYCEQCLEKSRKYQTKWRKRHTDLREMRQETAQVIHDEPTPPPVPTSEPVVNHEPETPKRNWPDAAAHTGTGIKYSRKCHDCGKPTNDYRCEKCRDKWKRKYGVIIRNAVEDGYADAINL